MLEWGAIADQLSEYAIWVHAQKYIRNNSVLLSERRNFDKKQPKCLCKWESEVSCWNSSEVAIVVVNQGQCRDT